MAVNGSTTRRQATICRAGASCVRGLGIVLVLAVALAAMSDLGFMVVAPALAMTLMWISGERRWRWFAIGAGLVPAAIWVFVVQILGRQLI